MLFAVVALAVIVWNPRFIPTVVWNQWQRATPTQQNKNALSVLFLGLATIGCLESALTRSDIKKVAQYRAPWHRVWVHSGKNSQHLGFWVELDDGSFAEFDAMDMSEWFIKDHPDLLKKP